MLSQLPCPRRGVCKPQRNSSSTLDVLKFSTSRERSWPFECLHPSRRLILLLPWQRGASSTHHTGPMGDGGSFAPQCHAQASGRGICFTLPAPTSGGQAPEEPGILLRPIIPEAGAQPQKFPQVNPARSREVAEPSAHQCQCCWT